MNTTAMNSTGMNNTGQLQARFEAALMGNYGTPPVALTHGKGCTVWDADGRAYTDFIAGIAVSSLGHAHPAIVEAVTRQVGKLAHSSNLFLHEPEILLAERLRTLLAAGPAGRRTPGCSSPTPGPRRTRRPSSWSGASRAPAGRCSWPPRAASTAAPWGPWR